MARTASAKMVPENPAAKEIGSPPVVLITPEDWRTLMATGGGSLALFLAITVFWILIFDPEFLRQIVP
jgi:hypothetical protein